MLHTHHLDHASLSNIDFRVKAGELVALYAPDLQHAQALFHILSGRCNPVQGHVACNGQRTSQMTPSCRRSSISCLSPQDHLPRHLRVLEVVTLGRSCGGPITTHDQDVAHAALEWVGIAHFRNRRLGDLTPGEQFQVCFARAAAQIWDQPKQGCSYMLATLTHKQVDRWTQERLLYLLDQLRHENYGVVVALEDYDIARNVADRLVYLNEGAVAYDGPLHQFRRHANFFKRMCASFRWETLNQLHPEGRS